MSPLLRLAVLLLGSGLAIPHLARPTPQSAAGQQGPGVAPAPGQITEKVACAAAPGQSYALYLPSRYSRDRAWPILYAFDAGARGLLPVQRFQEAAEKYGYIVVGSHNSRNGPMAVADQALRAMLADTTARFSIDPRRVYFTGFSGGARVAVIAATVLPRVAGVIGCAAGFPFGVQPSAATFAYFGTVGTDDFNFPEMTQLDEALAKAGGRHRIEIFEGPHDWAPPELCKRAIQWMEVQGIRSKLRPADEGLLDDVLGNWREGAEAEEKAGRPYEAWARYELLASTFGGLRDVSPYQRRARELAESKAVKRTRAEQADSIDRQMIAQTRLSRLASQAMTADDRGSAVLELLQALQRLKQESERPTSDATRMAARRVLVSSWSQLNEAVAQDLEANELARAVDRLSLMARIRPDNPRVDYTLARVHARAGRKGAALDALRSAIKKGFDDAAAVQAEPDFAPLREEDAYRQILAQIKR